MATKPPTEPIPDSSGGVQTNPQTEVVLHPVVQRDITYICEVNNSYLSHRIIDSFPRIGKWKIIGLKPVLLA